MNFFKLLITLSALAVIALSVLVSVSPSFRQDFFIFVDQTTYKMGLILENDISLSKFFREGNADSTALDDTSGYAEQQTTVVKKHIRPIPPKKTAPAKPKHVSLPGKSKTTVASNNPQSPAKALQEVRENQPAPPVKSKIPADSKEACFIYIESSPENGRVVIDGEDVGQTPLTVKVSQPGVYGIKVRHPYYQTFEKVVSVYASEVTKVQANLKRGKGSLTILSDPQQAEVTVDGESRGQTPLTIKALTTGKHQVQVVKNKREYRGEVDILANENTTLDISLEIYQAPLKVASKPSGADIYIDGIYYGRTPATLDQVRVGPHQVLLLRDDELAFVDSMRVYAGKENDFFAYLVEKSQYQDYFSAKLFVNSTVKDAQVQLNGKDYGKVPVAINQLRPGEHELLLLKSSREGAVFYLEKIFLSLNEVKEINVTAEDFKAKEAF